MKCCRRCAERPSAEEILVALREADISEAAVFEADLDLGFLFNAVLGHYTVAIKSFQLIFEPRGRFLGEFLAELDYELVEEREACDDQADIDLYGCPDS